MAYTCVLVQIVAEGAGEARLEPGPGKLEGAAHIHKGPAAQLPVDLPAQPQPVTHIHVNLLTKEIEIV